MQWPKNHGFITMIIGRQNGWNGHSDYKNISSYFWRLLRTKVAVMVKNPLGSKKIWNGDLKITLYFCTHFLGPFNNAYCEEIAYLFFFFFFETSQFDWPITQKQKNKKLWRLPSILNYNVPPLSPTYIGERRTAFAMENMLGNPLIT